MAETFKYLVSEELMRIDGSDLIRVPGNYWSSTTSPDGTKAHSVDSSRNVSFVTTDENNYVRVVRTVTIVPHAW